MNREPTFTTQHHDDCVVLRIEGEIDVLSAPLLRNRLADLCQSDLPVVVDLSRVAFLDSMALSVLVLAHKRLVQQNLSLSLCAPTRSVRLVLEVSALDQFIGIYDSSHAAQTALAGAAGRN